MDNKYFFSVLITVYNGASTILETLKSLDRQTFVDYEVLLLNDGSTDSTHQLVTEFTSGRDNFRYCLFDKIGRLTLLNLGIDMARGKFITILDADDLWHPQKLEFQYRVLSGNDCIKYLATRNDVFSTILPKFVDLYRVDYFKLTRFKFFLFNPISHSSFVFLKTSLRYTNLILDDFELYHAILRNGEDIWMLSDKLVFNRIHSNQNFQVQRIKYRNEVIRICLNTIFRKYYYYYLPLVFFGFIYRLVFSDVRRLMILKLK